MDGLKNASDLGIVLADFAFQFGELMSQFLVRAQKFPQFDKRAHDGDIDLNGALAV